MVGIDFFGEVEENPEPLGPLRMETAGVVLQIFAIDHHRRSNHPINVTPASDQRKS
jgi:hypothetical protein